MADRPTSTTTGRATAPVDVTDEAMRRGVPTERSARVTVGSYREYGDAQRAVDALSDDGFPVQHLRIVASDLTLVEQVTGRLTTWGAAGRGAGSGAVFGALIGALLGSFSLVDPLVALWVMAFWGLVIGAVIGAIAGAIGHAATRGRRDFDTVGGVQADRYDVTAAAEVAEDAEQRLERLVPTR